jgi:hypothetical protein
VYLPLLEETGTCRRRSTPTRRRSSSTAAIGATSTSTTTPVPDRGHRAALGRRRPRWIIRTNRGDAMRARFVVMATGPLHRPKLPGIDGIETFEGHSFHTSRWDYDYTGGDPTVVRSTGCRQARRDHRHRRHRRAVRPPPRRGRRRSCTCSSARRRRSTCATTAHRPGLVRLSARAGLAGERRMETSTTSSGDPRRRTWSTTAGPTSSATC